MTRTRLIFNNLAQHLATFFICDLSDKKTENTLQMCLIACERLLCWNVFLKKKFKKNGSTSESGHPLFYRHFIIHFFCRYKFQISFFFLSFVNKNAIFYTFQFYQVRNGQILGSRHHRPVAQPMDTSMFQLQRIN